MLEYTDPQASRLTWDQATKKLAAGDCAFESMNDSAFGELVAAGALEDQDFGSTAFPGTDKTFLAVVDVFVAATKAKNAKNALAFLAEISKPATQLAFNRAKGSVPVLRDIDISSLTAYQRGVLEGPVDDAGAAVDRPRRSDEPGIPRGLLRRRLNLRPDPRAPTPSRTTSKTRSPKTGSPNAEPHSPDELAQTAHAGPKTMLDRRRRPSGRVSASWCLCSFQEPRRVTGSRRV